MVRRSNHVVAGKEKELCCFPVVLFESSTTSISKAFFFLRNIERVPDRVMENFDKDGEIEKGHGFRFVRLVSNILSQFRITFI